MTLLRKLRKVFNLPESREVVSIGAQPVKDGAYWFKEAMRKSEGVDILMCPWKGCDGNMLDGPSGGCSTNVSCNVCERKWNLTQMIGRMDRI